jgi:hypothetical protein
LLFIIFLIIVSFFISWRNVPSPLEKKDQKKVSLWWSRRGTVSEQEKQPKAQRFIQADEDETTGSGSNTDEELFYFCIFCNFVLLFIANKTG